MKSDEKKFTLLDRFAMALLSGICAFCTGLPFFFLLIRIENGEISFTYLWYFVGFFALLGFIKGLAVFNFFGFIWNGILKIIVALDDGNRRDRFFRD